VIKKLFITFLAVLYLAVSSGATVHFQYCMGRLVKVGLANDHHKKAYACGMRKMAAKKCCKDKHQQFKTDKSNLSAKSLYSAPPAALLPRSAYFVSAGIATPEQNRLGYSHAPPLIAQIPIYLYHCIFRI